VRRSSGLQIIGPLSPKSATGNFILKPGSVMSFPANPTGLIQLVRILWPIFFLRAFLVTTILRLRLTHTMSRKREMRTPAEHHHRQIIWLHEALEERERPVDSDLIEIFIARFLNVLRGLRKTKK
jgi:hypothetical protein